MSEKQLSFEGAMMIVNGNKWIKLKDIEKLSDFIQEQQAIIEAKDSLLSILSKENEKLRQILKDIVVATDETYTKNTSMFKVTVVLDNEKYREIRRCIE